MLSFLKDHPFAVEAFFESSLVFTFAVPKEQIQHLVPECLELDVFDNKWAFIAVAILKSETDKKKMELLGNIFTYYNYTTTDIHQIKQNGITEISSDKSDFSIRIDDSGDENISLPDGSPFADWKEARRYSGPLPFTFTYNPADKKVLIIEGVRENWKPMPVKVIEQKFSFIDGMKLNDVRLANAFIIRNVPYYWKKGKIEQWK